MHITKQKQSHRYSKQTCDLKEGSRKKQYTGIGSRKKVLDEMDLTDTFRTFHPNVKEYTFFSSAPGTFSRIDHILGHRSNLSKFKKVEIISSIYSNHNAMRLDIIYKKKKKTVRNTNTWRLNSTFLNNQQVTEEIKREIKKFLETNDNEKKKQLKTYGIKQKQF